MSNQHARKPSDITRRSAINRIASGGAVGAIALTSFPGNAQAVSPLPIQAMTPQSWNALQGQRFRIRGAAFADQPRSISGELRLEQIIENTWIGEKDRNRPKRFRANSISLLFSADQEFPNASYKVENRQLGTNVFFLHKIQRADHADKMIYEVVVNPV